MSHSNSYVPTAPEMETTTTAAATATMLDSSSDSWNSDDRVSSSSSPSASIVSTISSLSSLSSSSIASLSSSSSVAEATTTTYSYAGSDLINEPISHLNDKKNMATAAAAAAAGDKAEDEKHDDSMFECNICLDIAKDAVVSMCGHLFCWPCLHQWLETRPHRKLCPVCKAAIGKDKVIPLYGRNTTKQEDPRNKVPPRPAGQRTEPETQQGFAGFNFGDGFHMSFGIGAFPFGYFASSFNFGEPRPAPANRGTTQYEDEQQLSKLFLYLAFLCIAWLLFA